MTESMNSRRQGAIGVARAIAYYAERGDAVFIPVSDTSRYDLVVDLGEEGLIRVEVKSTTHPQGEVCLRTKGGNKTGNTIKRLSADDCDVVFCVNLHTAGWREFHIKELEGRTTVRVR